MDPEQRDWLPRLLAATDRAIADLRTGSRPHLWALEEMRAPAQKLRADAIDALPEAVDAP